MDSDDLHSARPIAVVTRRFWASALNSDPGAVGRTLTIDGNPSGASRVCSATASLNWTPSFAQAAQARRNSRQQPPMFGWTTALVDSAR